jgi:hypothetical protein
MNKELIEFRKESKKKLSSLYNTHRSICYTAKGKNIGYPINWQKHNDFILNIPTGFYEGAILLRKDKKSPYSIENCYWGNKGDEHLHRLTKLEYKGITKTLLEWSIELNVSYNGIRQRYFKGKNYTIEEIIFGKQITDKRKLLNIEELSELQIRIKCSKMLSAYKNKDKKKNRTFDLTLNNMLEIVKQKCVYCGDDKNIGCDRLDNKLGHTLLNIVPSCYTCNVTRGDQFSYTEMLKIGEIISKIKKDRNEINAS